MFYTFNLSWAYLDKVEVGILCAVASLKNKRFKGDLSKLYRLTNRTYDKEKKVQTETRKGLRKAIDNLAKSGYIKYSTNGKYTYYISIIPDEKEDIEVFSSVLQKAKETEGAPWTNQIKLYLYIIDYHLLFGEDYIFTMKKIGDELGVCDTTITNAKNALVKSGTIQLKVRKNYITIGNNKSGDLDNEQFQVRTLGTQLFPSIF